MKKVLFLLACAVAMSGCAEMPKSEVQAGVKEEAYVMTGSRIARKSPDRNGPAVMDKQQAEQLLNRPATNSGQQ